jgi:3-dehydroquinate synthetase
VVIGDGAIETLGAELDRAKLGKRRILISSERVWNFHGERFRGLSADRTPILIEDGERYKNLNTVARLLDALVKVHADRSTAMITVERSAARPASTTRSART